MKKFKTRYYICCKYPDNNKYELERVVKSFKEMLEVINQFNEVRMYHGDHDPIKVIKKKTWII